MASTRIAAAIDDDHPRCAGAELVPEIVEGDGNRLFVASVEHAQLLFERPHYPLRFSSSFLDQLTAARRFAAQ
jgi:hypothetical protein